MPKAFAGFVLLLLAVLALPSTGNVVAAPPEKASGKMVLDEVSEGLRRYRREPDPKKQRALLSRLALIRDPRVTVALVEAMLDERDPDRRMGLGYLVVLHHIPPDCKLAPAKFSAFVELWWQENEAGVRGHAKQLPR